MSRHEIDTVAAWLRDRGRLRIASHSDPDGDSLGSSLALALGLEQLGCRAEVVLGEETPEALAWLPGAGRFRIYERLPADGVPAVLIECSDFARSGIDGYEGRETLNIDHHTKNALYADVNWIDPSVAATGMMIDRLLERLGATVTPSIATLLYVTVLTDTGSFQHSNTDAAALRFAADMVDAGADASAVAGAVYGNVPLDKLRLGAEALASLTLEADGRIAWMALPAEAFRRHRGFSDTDGLINQAQSVAGVSVSVLLKEVEAGRCRVSLRSDGSLDVAALAADHGGGGHPRAAGCQIEGDLDDVRDGILAEIRHRLGGAGGDA